MQSNGQYVGIIKAPDFCRKSFSLETSGTFTHVQALALHSGRLVKGPEQLHTRNIFNWENNARIALN